MRRTAIRTACGLALLSTAGVHANAASALAGNLDKTLGD